MLNYQILLSIAIKLLHRKFANKFAKAQIKLYICNQIIKRHHYESIVSRYRRRDTVAERPK